MNEFFTYVCVYEEINKYILSTFGFQTFDLEIRMFWVWTSLFPTENIEKLNLNSNNLG